MLYSDTESSSTASLSSPSSSEDFEIAALKKFEFGLLSPAVQQQQLAEKQKALDCGVCDAKEAKKRRKHHKGMKGVVPDTLESQMAGMSLDARRRRHRKNPKGTCSTEVSEGNLSLPVLEDLSAEEDGLYGKKLGGAIYLPPVTKLEGAKVETTALDAWWKKHKKDKSTTMSSFDSIVLPETREISSGELLSSQTVKPLGIVALPETTELDARHGRKGGHRRRSSRSRSRSRSPRRRHRHHYSSESTSELGHWRDDPDYWYWRRHRGPRLLDPVVPPILDPLLPPIVDPYYAEAKELGNYRDDEDYWYWRRHRRPRLLDPVVPPVVDPLLPPVVNPPVYYDKEGPQLGASVDQVKSSNLEVRRGHWGGGRRHWGGGGPYYGGDPYYWDPYYRRPPLLVDPLWPLLSDHSEESSHMELDARHRARDSCGRYTRRHRRRHSLGEESQGALLEEMKHYVETNYPAKPIETAAKLAEINEVRASMDKHFTETLERFKTNSLAGGTSAADWHASRAKLSSLESTPTLTKEPALVANLRDARNSMDDLLYQMEMEYAMEPANLSTHHRKRPRKHHRLSDPAPLDVKDSVVSRLATTLRYSSQVPEPGLRSMMLSGKAGNNLAAYRLHKEDSTAERHLAHSHTAFYKLLRENGLVPLLSSEPDLVVIVPYPATLDTITNRVSEETRRLMMYHLVVVPVAEPFQLVQTMQEYATMDGGNKVQVERRQECLYINGHHMKSDTMGYETKIYHIMGFLTPTQVTETTAEEEVVAAPTQEPPTMVTPVEEESTTTTTTTTPAEESTSESESSTGTSESELPPRPSPESLPPPSDATQHVLTILPTKAASLSGVNKSTTFKNSVISTLVAKMNSSYYSAQLDMASAVDATFSPAESATVSVRTYNPSALYAEYGAGRMRDISRIQSEGPAKRMVFTASQQKRLDIGNRLNVTEYSLNSARPATAMTVKKADLLSGLTEITVPSLTSPGKVCVLLCSIKASDTDLNTFMTEDEQLLLRFKNNLLDTITISHNQRMPLPTDAHDGAHFLELFTSERQRETLYKQKMTREQFTAMLLSASSVGKYVKRKAAQLAKKGRKAVGKAGRKVMSRADREKKRAGAMRTKTVALTNLPVAKLAAQETGAPKSTENLIIRVFGKDFTLLEDESLASVSGKKYGYVVGQDAFTGYLLEGENDLGLNLGRTRVGQYLEIQTPLRTISFNMSYLDASPSTYAYYGEKDSTVYLLQFAQNRLERLLILPKSSRFARKLGL